MREPFLRCYAELDRDGSWFAMCIDLNLYARAESSEAVKAELGRIIDEYVKEALTDDSQYARELLSRRAPLAFWAKYYLIYLVRRLVERRTREPHHILYKMAAPA